nr:MAG TPA: hypothetical protein [Bacteriophage sp.]
MFREETISRKCVITFTGGVAQSSRHVIYAETEKSYVP